MNADYRKALLTVLARLDQLSTDAEAIMAEPADTETLADRLSRAHLVARIIRHGATRPSSVVTSLASRSFKERDGFFGCTRCGAVSRRRMTAKSFSCDSCCVRAKTFDEIDFTSNERIVCGHCKGGTERQRNLETTLSWHPVLVQERDLTDKRPWLILRTVRKSDPIDNNRSSSSPGFLQMPIPMGLETNHLLQAA